MKPFVFLNLRLTILSGNWTDLHRDLSKIIINNCTYVGSRNRIYCGIQRISIFIIIVVDIQPNVGEKNERFSLLISQAENNEENYQSRFRDVALPSMDYYSINRRHFCSPILQGNNEPFRRVFELFYLLKLYIETSLCKSAWKRIHASRYVYTRDRVFFVK